MMRVEIPSYSSFNFKECKAMYDIYRPLVKDSFSFEEVIRDTFFYAFYDNDRLSLCVYFYKIDDKLWVSGYGIRKNYLFNYHAFKQSLTWFNCDVWAETYFKPAIYSLIACGFKKYKDGIYVYRRGKEDAGKSTFFSQTQKCNKRSKASERSINGQP